MRVKQLIICILVILTTNIVFAQKHKTSKVREHVGTIENFGTGEKETGGQDLEFRTLETHQGVWKSECDWAFEVVSGTVDKIYAVTINKYDAWATVKSDIGTGRIYDKSTFSRYFNQRDIEKVRFSVNGSHGQYTKKPCVVDVYVIYETYLGAGTQYKSSLPKGGSNVFVDGTSTPLTISLSYPGNKSLKIENPIVGSLGGTHYDNYSKSPKINLDETGFAKLEYFPPKSLSEEKWQKLSEQAGLFNVSDHIPLKIVIEYENFENETVYDTLKLNLRRPPVVFVHGFLGDFDTWGSMSLNLKARGFENISQSYRVGSGSIEDQSEALAKDIARITEFSSCKKVDLVCHSMGGLIARNYVQSNYYAGNVRKLITVGTPHHGVPYSGYLFGKIGSMYYNTHKIAINQLLENSRFLRNLNGGETSGYHRVSGIEYGNIYTSGWDGIVYAGSARLNMVPAYIVYDIPHSSMIGDPSLTNHPEVENQIVYWLLNKIKPSPNIYINAELSQACRGDIYRGYFPTGSYDIVEEKINKFPSTFELYNSLITKENGKAILHLKAGSRIWGTIYLHPNSEIHIASCSPQYMEVRLLKGKAQFRSYKSNGAHFIVQIHDKNNETHIKDGKFVFSPMAVITGLNTEFAVEYEDELKVIGMEGKMEILTNPKFDKEPTVISHNQSVIIKNDKITETKHEIPNWTINTNQFEKDAAKNPAEEIDSYKNFKPDISQNDDEKIDNNQDENLKNRNNDDEQSENEEAVSLYLIVGLIAILPVIAVIVIVIILLVKFIKRKEKGGKISSNSKF